MYEDKKQDFFIHDSYILFIVACLNFFLYCNLIVKLSLAIYINIYDFFSKILVADYLGLMFYFNNIWKLIINYYSADTDT